MSDATHVAEFTYGLTVSARNARTSSSPPNKNRNSDTKGLRFLFFCDITKCDIIKLVINWEKNL